MSALLTTEQNGLKRDAAISTTSKQQKVGLFLPISILQVTPGRFNHISVEHYLYGLLPGTYNPCST